MDTLLSMLRDRLHTSFILTDQNNTLLNAVAYPLAAEPILVKALIPIASSRMEKTNVELPPARVQQCFCMPSRPMGTVLSQEELRQIDEVVQLFVNIWNPQHNQFISEEMIRPSCVMNRSRCGRLSELFHIDVAALQEMWVLIPESKGFAEELYRNRFAEVLKENYKLCICDSYEKQIVAFTDGACLGERDAIAQDLAELKGTVFPSNTP